MTWSRKSSLSNRDVRHVYVSRNNNITIYTRVRVNLLAISCSSHYCEAMENGVIDQEREVKGPFWFQYARTKPLIHTAQDVIRRAKGNPDKTGSFVRLFVLTRTKRAEFNLILATWNPETPDRYYPFAPPKPQDPRCPKYSILFHRFSRVGRRSYQRGLRFMRRSIIKGGCGLNPEVYLILALGSNRGLYSNNPNIQGRYEVGEAERGCVTAAVTERWARDWDDALDVLKEQLDRRTRRSDCCEEGADRTSWYGS